MRDDAPAAPLDLAAELDRHLPAPLRGRPQTARLETALRALVAAATPDEGLEAISGLLSWTRRRGGGLTRLTACWLPCRTRRRLPRVAARGRDPGTACGLAAAAIGRLTGRARGSSQDRRYPFRIGCMSLSPGPRARRTHRK